MARPLKRSVPGKTRRTFSLPASLAGDDAEAAEVALGGHLELGVGGGRPERRARVQRLQQALHHHVLAGRALQQHWQGG
jgi:hypothetical protein